MPGMRDREEKRRLLESEIEKRLAERFAALRSELERLRAEFDGRWAGFAARLEQGVEGIVPVELLGSPEEAPAAGQVPTTAVRGLDLAATQVELLNHLLEASLRHASRAVLLVLRNDAWSVWKGAGFSEGPGSEGAVRKATLASPGARLFATPTAEWAGTAAERFREKIPAKSIAARLTWDAGSQKMLSLPDWRTVARSNSLMRSAIRNL